MPDFSAFQRDNIFPDIPGRIAFDTQPLRLSSAAVMLAIASGNGLLLGRPDFPQRQPHELSPVSMHIVDTVVHRPGGQA
jgi:hypothetical protein